MLDDNDPLRPWIGRSEEREATLDPWPAQALHAALELDGDAPEEGDPLPPFWRWLYFHAPTRRGQLGRDGHPALGQGLWPPLPSSRRMWAGGRLRFDAPAPLGARATLVSTVADITRKRGRAGPLAFLTLRHELRLDGAEEPAEIEEQDIVYVEEGPSIQAGSVAELRRPDGPPAPAEAPWRRAWTADATLLFRYSALTYNGHRIHYDLDYCRRVEGYPSLVVHGPLLATLMLELARERGRDRRVARFSFRAVSPILDAEAFEICGAPKRFEDSAEEGAPGSVEGATLWARAAGEGGRLAMTGELRFAAA